MAFEALFIIVYIYALLILYSKFIFAFIYLFGIDLNTLLTQLMP